MKSEVLKVLDQIPLALKTELVDAFNLIQTNYSERRWEPSELNGGKLCEVVYSIINGYFSGVYPTKTSKPSNMVLACQNLEAASTFPRSLRIQIPRMMIALYEVRNNRGVGHVGGDVNPNEMDAICVLHMSKWIVSELIRVFHQVSTDEAERLVSLISHRELPIIWEINGKSRVLDSKLSAKSKTLVLLYTAVSGLREDDLVQNLEQQNPSAYRRDVLRKAHQERLLEYDADTRITTISPLGVKFVEENIFSSGGLAEFTQ